MQFTVKTMQAIRNHFRAVISQSEIDACKPNFLGKEITLSCETMVQTDCKFEGVYKCLVCLNVVNEPKIVQCCQTLFCKKCLYKSFARQPSKCPKCRGFCNEEEPVRPIKNSLSLIEFKCQYCPQIFTHEKHQEH